jgi:SAM-dependent methyltransferase
VISTPTAPRYDSCAAWYDQHNADASSANEGLLRDLLGSGEGRCLDLGCGTGQNFAALRATGRTVVGLDYSADQLRLARSRAAGGEALVRGDAAALPFADGAFDSVVTVWLSTDVDDFAAVLAEAARVLRPGGNLVYLGAHPAFCGPHTDAGPDGARLIHPVYRRSGWHPPHPWWAADGIRRHLGMRHVPLAELLNGFTTAGLSLTRAHEPGDEPIPWKFALQAVKNPGA